jgi:hypothetical protein
MTMNRSWWSWAVAALALAGCGGEEDVFGNPSEPPSGVDRYPAAELDAGTVRAFATASAPNMFSIGVVLLIFPGSDSEDSCPLVTESGNQQIHQGGCTTSEGTEVFGRAVVTSDDESSTIDYQGFGFGSTQVCKGAEVKTTATYSGSMDVWTTGIGTAAFSLDIEIEASGHHPSSCATVAADAAYEYDGDLSGNEDAGTIDLQAPTTWSGSGRIGSSGVGALSTTTADELLDATVCGTEAASGTTTLEAGGDVAVITYDGASDCDPESTVSWSLNGVDQGELSEVRCSYGRGASGGSGALWLLLGTVLAWRRRCC